MAYIYIIIYLYIQYTSVISLWGKATCIMFAGPRSLGQGYHFFITSGWNLKVG